MLRVLGSESAHDETDGRSLLDESRHPTRRTLSEQLVFCHSMGSKMRRRVRGLTTRERGRSTPRRR